MDGTDRAGCLRERRVMRRRGRAAAVRGSQTRDLVAAYRGKNAAARTASRTGMTGGVARNIIKAEESVDA